MSNALQPVAPLTEQHIDFVVNAYSPCYPLTRERIRDVLRDHARLTERERLGKSLLSLTDDFHAKLQAENARLTAAFENCNTPFTDDIEERVVITQHRDGYWQWEPIDGGMSTGPFSSWREAYQAGAGYFNWLEEKQRAEAAEAEVERLKARLLTAAGDDLCRLTQEQIKAYTSGEVPIPPKEEFIASCERFHAQIASTAGVNTNCLTLAQLVAENERLRQELSAAEAVLTERQRFKDWVHRYLDTHGVPTNPPGTHGEHGCRIGDRMDWVWAEWESMARVAGGAIAKAIERAEQAEQAMGTMRSELMRGTLHKEPALTAAEEILSRLHNWEEARRPGPFYVDAKVDAPGIAAFIQLAFIRLEITARQQLATVTAELTAQNKENESLAGELAAAQAKLAASEAAAGAMRRLLEEVLAHSPGTGMALRDCRDRCAYQGRDDDVSYFEHEVRAHSEYTVAIRQLLSTAAGLHASRQASEEVGGRIADAVQEQRSLESRGKEWRTYAAELRAECERSREPIGLYLCCRFCKQPRPKHAPDCPHNKPLPEVPT